MNAQNLINQLSEADQKIFDLIIEQTSEKNREIIYDLIDNNPQFLQIMIDNYKEKVKAFNSQDSNKLQQIIDKEIELVEKMSKEE